MKNEIKIKHIIFDFDGVLYLSLGGVSSKGLNTELIQWIRKNHGRYTFSILSNSGSFLESLLSEELGIRDSFDNVYNSADIGIMKPDPAIFKYVLTDLGARREECLFIDDLEHNVTSAMALGINTILFSSNDQLFTELKSMVVY